MLTEDFRKLPFAIQAQLTLLRTLAQAYGWDVSSAG